MHFDLLEVKEVFNITKIPFSDFPYFGRMLHRLEGFSHIDSHIGLGPLARLLPINHYSSLHQSPNMARVLMVVPTWYSLVREEEERKEIFKEG